MTFKVGDKIQLKPPFNNSDGVRLVAEVLAGFGIVEGAPSYETPCVIYTMLGKRYVARADACEPYQAPDVKVNASVGQKVVISVAGRSEPVVVEIKP